MLEQVRKRLRLLVKLIEKKERKVIYTDFEDVMGAEKSIELPSFSAPDSYGRFRAKARHFLRAHEDHLTIHKLRTNEPLTGTDLDELERMLAESGIGTSADLEKAKTGSGVACVSRRAQCASVLPTGDRELPAGTPALHKCACACGTADARLA